MLNHQSSNLINYLKTLVTPERLSLLEHKLNYRTRYMTVCLENLFQTHNASAILRTCEAFGVQDVHVITDTNDYVVNPNITRGSEKWMDLISHQTPASSLDCMKALRAKSYRIVATIPSERGQALADFDFQKGPFALFFGTERTGLSQHVIDQADEHVFIPMQGFVESLNVSVSVAIMVQYLMQEIRSSTINWQLTLDERDQLMFRWLKDSVRSADEVIKRYKEQN